MTPTRWFLLLIALLGVVAFLALMAVEGEDRTYSQDEFVKKFERSDDRPGWANRAFALLGGFAPRLELRQKQIRVRARSTSQPIFAAASKAPFRRAAWLLRAGGMAIVRYEATKSEIEDLKKQKLELDSPNGDPKSLAIVSSGGKIWIDCPGDSDCVVELVD